MADERVVLDRRAGLVHRLNSTASCIWDRCDGLTSLDAIAAALAARFAVDRARARADVRATIARLAALGLLEPERGPRASAQRARGDDGRETHD